MCKDTQKNRIFAKKINNNIMPERQPDIKSIFSALNTEQKAVLYSRAAELFSDNKRALFDRLAPLRTRHISVALEDIYQSHNAAAVLRSCDCFGVQDVHVVEANNPFNPAGDVAVGSSKWVDYYRYNSIGDVYKHLRTKGYRIVATLPHENDTMIGDLDISQPTALVFGTTHRSDTGSHRRCRRLRQNTYVRLHRKLQHQRLRRPLALLAHRAHAP